MKRQERIAGFTVLEMILTVAIAGVVILLVSRLLSPIGMFFQRSQARQLANSESRTCMETLQRVMSNGKVSTLAISTPPTVPLMPFSRAQFSSADGSAYTITWSTSPMNSVHLQRTAPGGVFTDSILSRHVTGFHFTLDLNNPVRVHVTLQISVPLNSSGAPGSVYTLFVPKQPVLMLSS